MSQVIIRDSILLIASKLLQEYMNYFASSPAIFGLCLYHHICIVNATTKNPNAFVVS